MNPGRELDALIAEKVMGWKPDYPGGWLHQPKNKPVNNKYLDKDGCTILPPYSTDIAVAWEVVNILKEHKDYVCFEFTDYNSSPTATNCEEWLNDEITSGYFAGFCLGRGTVCAAALTAPHAICLAALKAVGQP